MDQNEQDSISEEIGGNCAEICKLIESKCLKPLEIPAPLNPCEENSPEWHFSQGWSYRLKGDFDSAVAQYRLGLKKNDSHLGLKTNLGVCFMKLGLLNKAFDIFKGLQTIHSYINLAICYISTQNYPAAVEILYKATSEDPSPQYLQLLSLALYRSGKVSEALENFREVHSGQSLMEDERNRRNLKHKNKIFPFKVGEVDRFFTQKHSWHSRRNSANSIKSTTQSTQRYSKSPRNTNKTRMSIGFIDQNLNRDSKSIIEFNYQPKPRPELPTYDEILSKKIQIDTIIRKRHNTLIGAMQSNLIDIKYNGFIQQKVELANDSPYKDLYTIRDYYGKVNKIHNELKVSKIPIDLKDDIDYRKFEGKRIGEHSMKILDAEYEKAFWDRDYETIENIVKGLPFFAKFPQEIRQKLLKCAVFKYYEPEEIIIKQGEGGDSMFVILSGSIKIMRKAPDFGNIEVTVNSMYDGETFGELALLSEGIGENIKRSATCAAGEKTKLLAISKKDYKSILLDGMQNDITGKVKFFNDLPFFSVCHHISLIPLASNIEPIVYQIDDRIIELGEKPKGLYIIYKGRCSLYWEGYVAKPSVPSRTSNIKIRPKTPKSLCTGNIVTNRLYRKSRVNRRRKSIDFDSEEWEKAKEYLPKDIDGKIVTKERILWQPLKEGDYFGGRSLVEGLLDIHDHSESSRRVSFARLESSPAKFTVIAESSEVKMFILTKRHFPLLSEELLVWII